MKTGKSGAGVIPIPSAASKIQVNIKVITALTMVHFICDFYFSFTIPLLPVFADSLSLSLTQVGILTGATRFFSFMIQPPLGYMADKYPSRVFIFTGVFMTVFCISLSGAASNFISLLTLLSIGAVGTAMIHPVSAGMVPDYSGKRLGLCMSVFIQGGTLAFAVGPLFAAFYVDRFGLSALPYTMCIGLFILAYLIIALPRAGQSALAGKNFAGSIKEVFGRTWKQMILINLIMVLRSVVGQSFLTFMPMLFARESRSLGEIGIIVSLYVAAGTVSGLAAGYFSDRFGHKPVFYTTFLLAAPSLVILLKSAGVWNYVFSFIGGFFILATIPLGVTIVQQLAPKGRSMAASITSGLSYGMGGVLLPVTGKLCDRYSIASVLFAVALIPLICAALSFYLPDPGKTGVKIP